MSPLTIASVHVHPVKSCGGIAVDVAALTRDGLAWDRQWAVVRADTGRALTQRDTPVLALISAALPAEALLGGAWGDEGGGAPAAALTLTGPPGDGHPPLIIPLHRPAAPRTRTPVSVWEYAGDADDEGEEAAAWVSAVVGRAVRLVRYAPCGGRPRLVAPAWTPAGAPPGAEAAFKDGDPLLVTSAASAADLAARLGRAGLDGRRFRANIVIAGAAPWEEDGWAELSIGGEGGGEGIRVGLAKPCDRCTIPAVNPETGVVDGKDITPALRAFRTGSALGWAGVQAPWRNAVFFGWNGAAIGCGGGGDGRAVVGLVRVGDPVAIVRRRAGPPAPAGAAA